MASVGQYNLIVSNDLDGTLFNSIQFFSSNLRSCFFFFFFFKPRANF